MLSRVPPPPRGLPPDALDVELRDMSEAILRGLPRVPPPPPPGARPPRLLRPAEEPEGGDAVQMAGRALIILLAVVMVGLFWVWCVQFARS